MTVRVEDWERRFDPTACRVVRTDWPGDIGLLFLWSLVTGESKGVRNVLSHDEVRDWPVCPPVVYTTAFRHEETRQKLEQVARNVGAKVVFGDMGEEAFRG